MNTFENAYSDAITLYDIEMDKDEFDEIALIAWRKIGNKITKTHRLITYTDENNVIQLPCNATVIESINFLHEDWDSSRDGKFNGSAWTLWAEDFIERHKVNKSHLYNSGKFVKYEQVGDTLHFQHPVIVSILYKGVEVDGEGLPCITDNESIAIAAYAIYTERFKKQIKSGVQDPSLPELKLAWEKACSHARVRESVSQNEMNEILDCLSTWNRKIFGKSYKPIV